MKKIVAKAKALGAVEFINWLEQSDLGSLYDIHDADNMLDYNQGNFNVYVFQTETQLWFYDGVLVNVNGEEL